MILTRLFNEFFNSEKSAGIFLGVCTLISLVLANFAVAGAYESLWNYEIAHHHLSDWINDGLMTIFFLLIGLELEREIYIGELSDFKKSLLPIAAVDGTGVLLAFVIPFGNGSENRRRMFFSIYFISR